VIIGIPLIAIEDRGSEARPWRGEGPPGAAGADESLLLSAIATVGGVLFAAWATPALLRFVASGRIGPMGMSGLYLDVQPDASVLAFSALNFMTSVDLRGTLAPLGAVLFKSSDCSEQLPGEW